MIGQETALSTAIRGWLASHPQHARELFGKDRLPTLLQYDPGCRLLEKHPGDGTIVVTALQQQTRRGAPLLRYCIGALCEMAPQSASRELECLQELRAMAQLLAALRLCTSQQASLMHTLPEGWQFCCCYSCKLLLSCCVLLQVMKAASWTSMRCCSAWRDGALMHWPGGRLMLDGAMVAVVLKPRCARRLGIQRV